jgi:hypothetical protein
LASGLSCRSRTASIHHVGHHDVHRHHVGFELPVFLDRLGAGFRLADDIVPAWVRMSVIMVRMKIASSQTSTV